MNRNVESHFSELPAVEIQRSIFDRSSTHKTSLNVGELVPFYVDEVLPGDTFRVSTSKVIRLQTMLTPIMDNMYLDTYFFFVPNRLVWTHWKEFMGENTQSAWVQQTQYQVPRISAPAGGFATGTLADYFGLPVGVEWNSDYANSPMALPFRAYALICNEFFRSENLTDPLNIPTGDANQVGSNGDNYINDVANGGKPFKVAKYFDAFTSALPAPQKATNSVTFPLISGEIAPVFALPTPTIAIGQDVAGKIDNMRFVGVGSGIATQQTGVHNIGINDSSLARSSESITGVDAYLTPSNLWADLSTSVGAVSINELRLAFQLQKFYERAARGGTRYIELLKSFFGVTSPDGRLQRPEYLGGNRVPLNVHEVTNNAQSETDFLGDLGAKSATSDIHEDFEKSFTEHGFVIGVMCIRYDHTYSQGLEHFWTRKDTMDYYFPVFANIGEVPVEQAELCATSENLRLKSTFGYQEAWYDYRYKTNRVSGEMRPGVQNTLASWHLADYYATAPTLSDEWLREDKTNVDRTLAVTSAVANQAFCDIYVKNIATRPMPMYSIPGLIDHN